MNSVRRFALSVVAPLAFAAVETESLSGQVPGCWLTTPSRAEAAQRPSPLDSATVSLGGGTVKVCYGSPAARGRTVMGDLVPWGEPWRMGANEATGLHTTVPIDLGGVRVAPGSYSLYAVPARDGRWSVVVNRSFQRWGIPIDPTVRSQDVGATIVTAGQASAPVERLRFRFDRADGGAELVMEWERTQVRVPVKSAGS